LLTASATINGRFGVELIRTADGLVTEVAPITD
jgi:hypothetical protein